MHFGDFYQHKNNNHKKNFEKFARAAPRVCVMSANKSVMCVTFSDVKVPWWSRLLDTLEYVQSAKHKMSFCQSSKAKKGQMSSMNRWKIKSVRFPRKNFFFVKKTSKTKYFFYILKNFAILWNCENSLSNLSYKDSFKVLKSFLRHQKGFWK